MVTGLGFRDNADCPAVFKLHGVSAPFGSIDVTGRTARAATREFDAEHASLRQGEAGFEWVKGGFGIVLQSRNAVNLRFRVCKSLAKLGDLKDLIASLAQLFSLF